MRSQRTQNIVITSLVVGPLLGVVAAMTLLWNRYVFPSDLVLFFVLYIITVLGITIGYHRMLTHNGFKTSPFVRGVLLICGCMAFEGSPNAWVSTHVKHHAHSDEEGDPHSPIDGFWHSHFGWLYSLKNFPEVQEYAPHLLEDRVVQFVDRNEVVWIGLSLLIPALIGGWTGLLWGGVVRIFCVTHVTWSVNSVCHTFGRRPFESHDESRNEWLVGILGLGEGWHNNHHAFPENAFHGLRWWQFDLSGYVIRVMEKLGLIWDVQRVSQEAEEAKRIHGASVRETLLGLKEQLAVAVAEAREDLSESYVLFKQKMGKRIPSSLQRKYDEASTRLEDIQHRVTNRRHFRKKKVEAYKQEIRELVTSAKQHMKKEMKKRAPARV